MNEAIKQAIKHDLYRAAKDLDGVEVHQSDWEAAKELVKDGVAVLSSARGPNRAWKRLTIIGIDI